MKIILESDVFGYEKSEFESRVAVVRLVSII